MLILNRIKTRSQIERDPRVLCEDDFRNGPQGWTNLIGSASPTGVMCLDNEITFNGSPYSLFLTTADMQDSNGSGFQNTWGSATAIKRMFRGDGMSKLRAEWVFAYGSQYGGSGVTLAMSPRMIQFGIDTAKYDGTRHYYSMRYLISSTSTLMQKWQVLNTDSSTYTDIPGANKPLQVNENKRDLIRVEAEFDLTNARYLGLRVNGDGYGSLAPTADTTISSIAGPATESLPSFGGGLNQVFAIRNRGDTTNTRCWANLAYAKVVAT